MTLRLADGVPEKLNISMNPMPALRAMNEAEYSAWLEYAIPAYAAEKVRSGNWLQSESLDRACGEVESLWPNGLATQNHTLFTILGEPSVPVGALWMAESQRLGGPIAYLYNLVVWPEHRRKGYATRALRALELEVARRGLAGIALHVFGHNTQAQALYRKLGYETTNINLFKALTREHQGATRSE
jgi:GNAT superfamily N-acetyltransferase